MKDEPASGIVRALLVIGGSFHDFDMVRRRLLERLGEHERIRTTCTNGFHDLEALRAADFLVTYTTNIFPEGEALSELEQFLARGGRWLAIHGSAAYIEFSGPEVEIGGIKLPGLTDTPDRHPAYMDLLGCRFLSHLAPQPFTVRPVSDHPIVAGLPPFEVVDEPYILELRGESEILLESRYTGDAPGYVKGPWLEDTPRPQAVLHRHGEGEALFLAPGHSCGRYDMQPFIAEIEPQVGPWDNPVYMEVIRRAIRWGARMPVNAP
ncbi:ThuA domain-containing protein [Sphingobium sp. Cam5-1]|uniref:ThuA domain-containing protein n=1 Tax=Sphingobium sp. Cam5-1 TaxID=2789327 RepID=UPI0018AD11AA|nr:ThuA domain-containing protein [Sphingobium sp. Cam5-1]QPI74875.1 ThuA domain-containing protein [Sphingobium sp. Cam5-1]